MGGFLKQATSATVKLGRFVSPADGLTPYTAGGFTVKVSANGGALAARHDGTAITHDADGLYAVVLDTTDTGAVNRIKLEVPGLAGSYLPVDDEWVILNAAVYDVFFGTTAPSTYAGGAVASVTGAVGSVAGAVGSVTGNVGGSVGSVVGNVGGSIAGNVTGSVASVLGNVGGNVVGSVASVVGAVGGSVGSVTGNVGGNVVGSVASVVGAVGGNVVGSVASVTAPVTADVDTIKTKAITCANPVTIAAFVGAAGAAGANSGIPILPATGSNPLPVNVTKWSGDAAGVAVDANHRPLMNCVPALADLAILNSLARSLLLTMPSDSIKLAGALPSQAGASASTTFLDPLVINSSNCRPGDVFTITDNAGGGTLSSKNKSISTVDYITGAITFNDNWGATLPVTGEGYQLDSTPKTRAAGFTKNLSPDYFMLGTPNVAANRIATDSSGRVAFDPATLAAVWSADGALTVVDGVGAANLVQVDGGPITVVTYPTPEAIAAAVCTDVVDMVSPPSGSLGARVNAAGNAGDPLATDLALAGYTGTQAGAILFGLDGDTLLPTFRTQIANTAPTRNDAITSLWSLVAGESIPNEDGSVNLYGPAGTDGPVIAVYLPPDPLPPNALDNIDVSDPGVAANWTTLPKLIAALGRRFFGKARKTLDPDTKVGTIELLDAAGETVNATQAISDDGVGNEIQGESV